MLLRPVPEECAWLICCLFREEFLPPPPGIIRHMVREIELSYAELSGRRGQRSWLGVTGFPVRDASQYTAAAQ